MDNAYPEAPLVTVITVTYNSSAYVRSCIESVLAQKYARLQYIIGDDCSPDNTWQIINEYKDDRITAYRNDTNLREYPNRNKALGLAKGKYLIFIDGDDLIYPHGIGFFVDMMERFPEAAMAVQKGYMNNMLFPALLKPDEAVGNFFIGKENLLSSSFVSDFYRTDKLLGTGLLKVNHLGGDNEIRLRMAARYPVLLTAGWVSWSRETPGQASQRISLSTHLVENFELIGELENSAENHLVTPGLVKAIRQHGKGVIARFALRLLAKGQIRAARELLRKTGMSWQDVAKSWHHKSEARDFLESYSAVNPFRRGFLKDGKINIEPVAYIS